MVIGPCVRQDLDSNGVRQDLDSNGVRKDLDSSRVRQGVDSNCVRQDLDSNEVRQDFDSNCVRQDLDSSVEMEQPVWRVRLRNKVSAMLLAGAMLASVVIWPQAAYSQSFTLNLQDADIDTLISTVAEVTGRNFIVDPRVQGKVTVISSRPLRDDEIYQVFLSVLKVHGYAAVRAGNVTKIVPAAEGIAAASGSAANADEVITRVIAVRNVPAERLVPALRPLLPQLAHLAAQADSNALVVSASRANVDRIASVVRRMDVATRAEVEVVKLRHASAEEIAASLRALQPADSVSTAIVADARTNSLLVSGDDSSRKRIRRVAAMLDTPERGGGNTQVVKLRYSRAEELVGVLDGLTGGTASSEGKERLQKVTTIHADASMNALIITTTPSHMRTLRTVISQLDVKREQVLVEGIIAEMTGNRAEQLGVQWRVPTTPGSGGVIGGTNFNGSGAASSIASLLTNPISTASGLSLGLIDGSFSFNGTQFANFALLARALSTDSDVNILSTPSIVTIDNRSAEIVVAQNVPFLTGQFTNAGGDGGSINPFQTIERQDVGLILKVRPQINDSDELLLEIEQEVSSIASAAAVQGSNSAVDLVTNKRAIRTAVMIKDGEVLVLGGLIREAITEVREGVPFLGDLPIIGQLFSNDDTSSNKTNLMVFLRPTILRDGVAKRVTQKRYDLTRARQMERTADGVNLMPDEREPVLPALQGLLDQLDPIIPERGDGPGE